MKTPAILTFLFPILSLLIACQSPKSDQDGGLELSDAQLKELIKNRPAVGGESNPDASILKLEAAYATDSNLIDNVYNLAFLYCQKCLYEADSLQLACNKTLQYLNRCIVLDAKYRNGNAYYNRMLCQQHLGNLELALEDLNQYISLNKGIEKPAVNYHLLKASLLYKLDKKTEACLELKSAEKFDTTGMGSIAWKKDCR